MIPIRQVEQLFLDYKNAIEWIEPLIPDIKPTCRIYNYLELLEITERANTAGIVVPKPTLLILEAAQHALVLTTMHKAFKNRNEKEFVDKLRVSLQGPSYSNREVIGESTSKGAIARNIESELILASRIKNQKIVSFESNDVVYDLDGMKFGMEVKRVHSLKKLRKRFIEGCEQIERTAHVNCGMVAIRFDKHFYIKSEQGVVCIERDEKILTFDTWSECVAHAKFHNISFLNQYGQDLLELARTYPKVLGVCVFSLLPGLMRNTSIPFVVGQFDNAFFGGCGKGSEEGIKRYLEELRK